MRGLEEVLLRIEEAAARSGRDPDEVRLVVVGKGHPPDALMAVYQAGHRDFGESRAQELVRKAGRLPGDVRWHFVGPLQRNKVRRVRPLVTLLHSLDRIELAESWLRRRPAPPALLEVNVGGEDQKLGIAPEEVDDVADRLVEMGLELRGLMTIPPRLERPGEAAPFFRRLAELGRRLSERHPEIRELSMGMSDDFEAAVEAGATLVRVGRAIFDPTDDRRLPT